jgi:hypothetical protein
MANPASDYAEYNKPASALKNLYQAVADKFVANPGQSVTIKRDGTLKDLAKVVIESPIKQDS